MLRSRPPVNLMRNMLPALGALLLVLSCACLAWAQEEKPARDAREKLIIKELRSGTWKLVKVEQLVKRFISRGQRHAARWWTLHAGDASGIGLLPPTTKKNLRIIGKVAGLKPSEPQLRAMPARALRHLKQVFSLKCYAAIPGAVHFARRCLELYPDQKMKAKVDAIEAEMESVNWSEAKPYGKALKKSAERLTAALTKARDDLLDDMIEQYKSYPCPPGARAIRALILAHGEEGLSTKWQQAWQEVAAIEYAVEPKQKLRIWLENGGKVYVYRYGKRFLSTAGRSYFGDRKQGVTFEVLAGDVLQIEVKKPHAKKAGRKLFVVAVAADLDGQPLASSAWLQNSNHEASSLDPILNPMCHGIEFAPERMPKDLEEEVLAQAQSMGTGILIPTASEYHHYAVDMHKKLQDAIHAFQSRKRKYTWIAGEADRLAVVLRIPRWGERDDG